MQAVVFDVDGTLVDSERDGHRVAFNQAFAAAGLPYEWDVELYGRLLDVTGGDHRIRHYLAAVGVRAGERARLARRLHTRKTEIFIEMVRLGQIEPRPGARRLLEELQRADVPVAVATTGRAAWVEPLLKTSFSGIDFAIVVTGSDVPALKPDPSVYRIVLRRLGVATRCAVAVEDSRNGLRAASSAGLGCVVVANDYTSGQRFDEADLVLDGFGELSLPALRRLVGRRSAPPAMNP